MKKKNALCSIAMLVAGAAPLLATGIASAAGIQTTLTSVLLNANGTGASDISLFVNGAPLAMVEGQVVSLGVGDTLRAELSASAMHESGAASSFNPILYMNFVLDSGTAAATVQTDFSGTVNATPEVAQGAIFSSVGCDFTTTGCSAPGLPLSTAFLSNVISSTLSIQSNETTVNNVKTLTGRVGGIETINVITLLNLQSGSVPAEGSVSLGGAALAIFEASASTSGALELTVTSATVVPVPAVGWLLGPALLVLGWRRKYPA